MNTSAAPHFTLHSESELSVLCQQFIKALEATEPFTTEWKIINHNIDSLMSERRRRLHRIRPGW